MPQHLFTIPVRGFDSRLKSFSTPRPRPGLKTRLDERSTDKPIDIDQLTQCLIAKILRKEAYNNLCMILNLPTHQFNYHSASSLSWSSTQHGQNNRCTYITNILETTSYIPENSVPSVNLSFISWDKKKKVSHGVTQGPKFHTQGCMPVWFSVHFSCELFHLKRRRRKKKFDNLSLHGW